MGSEAIDEKITFPSVSIIVATLNSESTIDECLDSILELDYPEQLLEVIVVDGGSKDSTVERVKAHSVKVIKTQLNTPAGYNSALKTIKSEIVGFIDSDAKVEKQWLKKLVTHLNSPEVAGASGTIETWNDNKLVPRCIGYELSYRYNRLPKEIRRVATMNLILKKRLIEKVVGYDEALSTQYDTDLGIRLASAGYKIIFDPGLKIPLGAQVLKSKQPGVIVVTRRCTLAQKKKKSALLKKKAILVDAPMQGRYFNLKKLLKALYRQGIMSVFVEGGAFTVGAFFDQRCVDKIYFFLAPKIVGGSQALSSVGGAGVSTLREAYCVENVEIKKIGLDFLITGYPVKK